MTRRRSRTTSAAAGLAGRGSVADEIRALGRRVARHRLRRRRASSRWRRWWRWPSAELGRIDILVNNAALPSEAGAAPILDVDDAVWYRTVDVNLNGLYLVTKLAGRAMRDGGRGGCIVNISSMAGRQGLPNYGAYCATKWGMIGLTQQLAVELAPHGIRVNCICPGSTDTDMMDGTFGRQADRYSTTPDKARQGAISRIPMGRQGDVERAGRRRRVPGQ